MSLRICCLVTASEDRAVRWTRLLRAEGWRVERRANAHAVTADGRGDETGVAVVDLALTRPRPSAAVSRLREQAPGWSIVLVAEARDAFGPGLREATDSGADDVISAVVEADELASRLSALASGAAKVLETADGKIRVDLARRQAWACLTKARLLPLTRTEFDLLAALLETPGAVRSRQQLMERVWPDGEVNGEAVDRHISSLRRKLASLSKRIRTAHGTGYVAA